MLYLIQWGDNMAYSSNFQKGLMMGLAMNGLPVSDNQSSSSEPYVLPIASSTVLGGIKLGDDLSIDSEGVVSIPALKDLAEALDKINGEVI